MLLLPHLVTRGTWWGGGLFIYCGKKLH